MDIKLLRDGYDFLFCYVPKVWNEIFSYHANFCFVIPFRTHLISVRNIFNKATILLEDNISSIIIKEFFFVLWINNFLKYHIVILKDLNYKFIKTGDYLPYIKVKHIRFKIVTVAENLKKKQKFITKKVGSSIYFTYGKHTFLYNRISCTFKVRKKFS